jgi:hypothetical protein
LPIFDGKNCRFLKNHCYDQILHYLALFWVKNANFFAKFLGENIFKIITSTQGTLSTSYTCKNVSFWLFWIEEFCQFKLLCLPFYNESLVRESRIYVKFHKVFGRD